MGIFTGAIGLILASAVVGAAICGPQDAGRRWSAAPAIGFAALMVLSYAAIKLPGRGTTAAIICLLAIVWALGVLVRRRESPLGALEIIVATVALAVAALPFIAQGRVGLLGPTVDDDTSLHLLWAEALRSARGYSLFGIPTGYPLGPHALADVMASAGGLSVIGAFTSVILVTVPMMAITAAGVLGDEPLWRRAWVGLMSAFTYAFVGYYAESSFKEPIMAIMLLGAAVHVQQIRPVWAGAGQISRGRSLAGVVILAAGAVYDFSYFAIAWFAAAAVIWWAAEALAAPRALRAWRSRERLRLTAVWGLGITVLGLILLAPVLPRLIQFFDQQPSIGSTAIGQTNIGNLIGALPFTEGLGQWLSNDLRYVPVNAFGRGELAAAAIAALVYGFWSAIRNRQFLIPSTALAAILIWWWTNRTQSPYVSAKSLVVMAPATMALSMSALLARRSDGQVARITVLLVAAALSYFGLRSSTDLLRSQPVQAPQAGADLGRFAHLIGDHRVLFLGASEYAAYALQPAQVSEPTNLTGSHGINPLRAGYPPGGVGYPLDFDSVPPAELNRFRWVITSNADFQSQAFSNFRRVARGRLYDLWQRTGPTVPRGVIGPAGSVGAILDCRTPAGLSLSRKAGEASVTAAPVSTGGSPLAAGSIFPASLKLGRGRWDISIQYTSAFPFDVSSGGDHYTMPAFLGNLGSFFNVGAVSSNGEDPVNLSIYVQKPSFLTTDGTNTDSGTGTIVNSDVYALINDIVATRLPNTHTLIPLHNACGKYVDWYRLSASTK